MNIDTLYEDFKTFQISHTWYKHIPFEGRDFYVYQEGVRWHFLLDEPSSTGPVFKVRFGPFLRGLEGKWGYIVWGLWIIRDHAGDRFASWISNNYPEWSDVDWDTEDDNVDSLIVIELFARESEKYWNALLYSLGIDVT